uniref:tRNA (adenine(58)-N(1))-methyltransferase non-catalytic subunit TRM6 n=1 Tax=Cyprinus carpio TaxID=7962 RepID=A0A8C1GUE9_CYPCA
MAESVNDSDAESRISFGDYVVLKRGDVFKSVQVENKKKVIFEKQWFFLDNAVGQLFGTRFEIEAGGSLKLKAAKHSGDSLDSKEAGQDNRHILDDGKSQKLTRDDIETLKEQGLKGQEIVQQLIDNSTTFKDKTEFAQEKYIKKKKKNHLRYDTLAQILTLGNIHAGSKILVFETCAGLVLGSVMERMGGFGSVIQMYPGGGPTRAGMESFGFPSHFHETLHEFPLCKVNALLAGTLDLSEKDADGNRRSESSQETSGVSEERSSEPQSMEVSVDPQEEMRRVERERLREQKAQEKKVKMEEKRKKLASAAALLEGRNADGLVIASRFHPCPVLMGLLKFIAPSRPFVVYCQYREPLIECYTKLREQGGAISLRLTDSWLRHYQVLPNRTHPVLLMSGGGGYLLSGTTVAADAAKTRNQQKSEEPVAKRLKLDEISSA